MRSQKIPTTTPDPTDGGRYCGARMTGNVGRLLSVRSERHRHRDAVEIVDSVHMPSLLARPPARYRA